MKQKVLQVTLVGRTNVGKSTLFNRLTEENKALVSPLAGTTRDLNTKSVSWRGITFELVDTGGLDIGKNNIIANKTTKKAWEAIKQANLVLFMVDGQTELLPSERKAAKAIKKLNKQTLLVINKIDNPSIRQKISPDFFKLGLGDPSITSAINGIGTGDLLDTVVAQIKTKSAQLKSEIEKPYLKLSIIGKTNVGKSSILNTILNEEKVIVTPLPHTTREPRDTLITYKKHQLLLIDTAGLRKKGKISDPIEKISFQKTLEVIKDSDISALITDVSGSLSIQDAHIANLALENHKGLIIVANKWDLIKQKETNTINTFTQYYRRFFPYLLWAPIIFISAQENLRVRKILELAINIKNERAKIIDQDSLNTFLKNVTKKQVSNIGKDLSLYQFEQTDINPPKFLLSVQHKETIHKSFKSFLEKKLRERFGFKGTPVIIALNQPKG